MPRQAADRSPFSLFMAKNAPGPSTLKATVPLPSIIGRWNIEPKPSCSLAEIPHSCRMLSIPARRPHAIYSIPIEIRVMS